MYMGNYEEVIKLKEEILRVMQKRLNDRWYALESCSVSWAFSHLGRWDEAIEEGQKALGFAQGIADKSLVTFVNFVLSYAYIWKGVPRLAIKYGQIAVDKAPTPSDKTWAQGILSWAWCRAGNPKKGVDELVAILPISRERNFMPTEIIHTIMLAEGYWQLREVDKANATLKQGIDLAERCGMKFYLGWAHRLLGEIALETDLANAAAHFEQGIGFFKEIKAQNE
jgi:tetratricopeptide (TPR) repeat protein